MPKQSKLSELGRAARCFFDWPKLHTRVYVYCFLGFAGYEINKIIDANIAVIDNTEAAHSFTDSRVLFNISDYLITGALCVIGFYVSPRVADYLADLFSSRVGGARPRRHTTDKEDGDAGSARPGQEQ